jgi:hypothetical protein
MIQSEIGVAKNKVVKQHEGSKVFNHIKKYDR